MKSRLRYFVRMNPPIFLDSKVGEDPQQFVVGVYKVLSPMEETSREKEELASYQLREVAQVCYTRWKDNLMKRNMTVEEYSFKFSMLSRYTPHLVSIPRDEMSYFVTGVTDLVRRNVGRPF